MNSNKRFRRSAVALAAGASLVFGVAACSDEDKDNASDAANSATEKAGEAADSATSKADEAKDDAKDAKDDVIAGAEEETEKVQTADGEEVEVPKGVKTAWENEGGEEGTYGKLTKVETNDKGALATFENGWIASSKDHGAVPLIGKIGETWANGGGLDNELGLPTAPESGDAANGWTQSFENGTLEWTKDESGNFSENIEMR